MCWAGQCSYHFQFGIEGACGLDGLEDGQQVLDLLAETAGDGWDLLLTPTMAQPPAPIGFLDVESDNPLAPFAKSGPYVPFTAVYNGSYQPAISLPTHWTPDGLPVGVQLVAGYAREDLLIRVASQLEQAVGWLDRRPT